MTKYVFDYNEKKELCVEGMPVRVLAEKYGTPLNILSLTQLTSNLRRFKNSFGEQWQGKVRILPAIKANTSTALCKALSKETEGCDLFSEGEMRAALAGGFEPQFLSLNGNSKLTRDMNFLEFAIDQGVRITMDDKSEFEAIEEIAKKLKKRVTVRLRLRLDFSNMNDTSDMVHGLPVASELSNFIYKAGVPKDDLEELSNKILKSEWFNLSGVHIHLGRHRKEVEYWNAMMIGYAAAIKDLKNMLNGWEPDEIDIGGGFAQHHDPFVSYKEEQGFFNEVKLLNKINRVSAAFGEAVRYKAVSQLFKISKQKKLAAAGLDLQKNTSPSIEIYSECIATLRTELNRHGIDTSRKILEVEPGRGLFGSAGIHVTQVSFIKKQSRPISWNWVITDTTDFWLQGAPGPPNQPYIVDGKPIDGYTAKNRMIADIVGVSCGADRITGDACLPGDLTAGDLIIYIGTGAYQEMQSPNFNSMGRPAAVAVMGDKEGIIRRRETPEDVFRREEIPSWI